MRKRLRQAGKIGGELLEQVKVSTNSGTRTLTVSAIQSPQSRPAANEKYFRSWPRLRVVLESGGQTSWIRRLVAGLNHEVLVAYDRQLQPAAYASPPTLLEYGKSAARMSI